MKITRKSRLLLLLVMISIFSISETNYAATKNIKVKGQNYSIVTSGAASSGFCKLYQKVSGKNKQLLKLKNAYLYYYTASGNNIYFNVTDYKPYHTHAHGSWAGCDTACFNIKTKKFKWLSKDTSFRLKIGNYAMQTSSYYGDGGCVGKAYSYNLSSGKKKLLGANCDGLSLKYMFGRVYYAELSSDYSYLYIKSCMPSSAEKRTIAKINCKNIRNFKANFIKTNIYSTYCTIAVGRKTYRAYY
ncbi:MAG: hypothetical protein PHR92_05375 [Lachnospiraceae bacterium]|nr:hypothetical protein [Lachnospiraceae bacterium]